MQVYFEDNNFLTIERNDGLYYVTVNVIYEGSTKDGEEVKLILDTGAFMTVLSRGTAIKHGFDKLPKKAASITGFGGTIPADVIRIPGVKLLNRLYMNVPILVPHEMYRVDQKTGKKKQMQEVLGLNILEYYNYYVDVGNDRLYLKENPNPKFLNEVLKSGDVFTLNLDQIEKIEGRCIEGVSLEENLHDTQE